MSQRTPPPAASHRTQPPESDLIVPLHEPGRDWDPSTVHTHYFGFCVPEAALGVFIYVRYQPYYPLVQGGVLAFQGVDNLVPLDMVHHDYQVAMPWPEIADRTIAIANGLVIEFIEPGHRARITYASVDGEATIDVIATAVTPLAARGHVVPGEELNRSQQPGGSEQFMRYVGEIAIRGARHAVDCVYVRDRSWRQVRSESVLANRHPPIAWTPVYFDEDFAFNQIGVEDPGSHPLTQDVYPLPAGAPTHHFAWVSRGGEVREVTRVRRVVTRHEPHLLAPLAMEIEAEDSSGDTYTLRGEAIALAPIPQWPNLTAFDSVYRWEDATGRVAYGTVQGAWNGRVQQEYKRRRLTAAGA